MTSLPPSDIYLEEKIWWSSYTWGWPTLIFLTVFDYGWYANSWIKFNFSEFLSRFWAISKTYFRSNPKAWIIDATLTAALIPFQL